MADVEALLATFFGPDEAAADAADEQLSALVLAGDPLAQRALVGVLTAAHVNGEIGGAEYIGRAEGIARSAAGSGEQFDVFALAALLELKGYLLAAEHRVGEAVAAQAEALSLLDRLADEGNEPALSLLTQIAPMVMPEALVVAGVGRRLSRHRHEGRPMPVEAPPVALRIEASAESDPFWAGDPLAEPTRRERLKWWAWGAWYDLCDLGRAILDFDRAVCDRAAELRDIILNRGE